MNTIHKSNNDIFYQIYRLFSDHFIKLVYHGLITSEKADVLINIFEQLIGQNEASIKIQKRAFYILVEALQNVIRHQAKPNSLLTQNGGTLIFQYLDGQFMFTLKNLVETVHTGPLKKKIDSLNRMNKDSLNKYYKKVLKNDVLSEKGGAGLGLIEIARKSENTLHYDIREADDTYSYFYLNMLVTDPFKKHEAFPENGINIAKRLQRLLQNSGNWFILGEEYHSGLSPDLQVSLHRLFGNNSENEKFKKFLTLLNLIPELCLASSGVSSQQKKFPCLYFFGMAENHLSVYTTLLLPYASPFDFSLFSNLLSERENLPNNIPGKINMNDDKWRSLRELPALLSSPPKIMMQEISPGEKFVILKFSF